MNKFQRVWQIVECHQADEFDYPEGNILVDAWTATMLTIIYRALATEDNKQRFAAMLETRSGLLKLTDFGYRHLEGER